MGINSGHLSNCTRLLMLKFIMSMIQAVSSSTPSMMPSTVTSSDISTFVSGLGSLEMTSAIVICLPGRYTRWKSHPCVLIRSRCRRGCALFSKFAVYHEQRSVIGYDDEWFAKEIHVWNFVTPFTIASISRSMFEYAYCAGVSVFDANATGLLSCRRHAHTTVNPFCEASTFGTVSFCEW